MNIKELILKIFGIEIKTQDEEIIVDMSKLKAKHPKLAEKLKANVMHEAENNWTFTQKHRKSLYRKE